MVLVRQANGNLLSNALKFIAPGASPRIHITAESGPDDTWVLGVRDEGIGIEPGARRGAPAQRVDRRRQRSIRPRRALPGSAAIGAAGLVPIYPPSPRERGGGGERVGGHPVHAAPERQVEPAQAGERDDRGDRDVARR